MLYSTIDTTEELSEKNMSINLPPSPYVPNLYNSADYFHNDQSLTIAIGDSRYLQLTGGILIGNLFASNGLSISGSFLISGTLVTSTAAELNYNHGITPGTASASSTLVVDSSRNIANINNLTATNLYGTIQTASQSNITTVGNLTGLTMFGDILMSGHNISSANTISATTLTGTLSAGAQNNITTLNGCTAVGLSSSTTLTGTLSTPTQGSITSLGTLTALTMAGAITMGSNNISGAATIGCVTLNVSGQFNNTSSTNATSASTGAITTSGGIGITKDLWIGSTSTASKLTFQTNDTSNAGSLTVTGGTSSAVNTQLQFSATKSYFGTQSNNDFNLLSNNTTRTTLLAGGSIGIANTSPACTLDIAGTARVTSSATPSSGAGLELTYGSGIANLYSYDRSGAAYKDINFNDKMYLNSSGALMIGTKTNNSGFLNITSSGQSLYLWNNNSTSYVSMGCDSSGELLLTPSLSVSSYNQYCISGTSPGYISYSNSIRNNHRLDFGATAQDNIICLFQANGLSGTYMIGANNGACEYVSAGSSGHKFYYNSTSGVGAPAQLGTNIFTMDGSGNATASNNMFAVSYFATGFSGTGLSGAGAKFHYGGGAAQLFGYNYTSNQYLPTAIGNNNIYCLTSGHVNINTASTSDVAPLAVYGSSAFTRSIGTYGYLASSGSGTASGFTGRSFGIYSQYGIIIDTGEIDCFSDLRLKKEVEPLDSNLCNRFIRNINPIQFKYVHNDTREHYGFAAQQLVAHGFDRLVGFTNADEPLPSEKVDTYDHDENGSARLTGDSINLPSDVRLTICMMDMIPMLHKCIQQQDERIRKNEQTIKMLERSISSIARSKESIGSLVQMQNINNLKVKRPKRVRRRISLF